MNQKHQNPLFSDINLISSKPFSNLRCYSWTAILSVFPSVKLKIVTHFLKGRNSPSHSLGLRLVIFPKGQTAVVSQNLTLITFIRNSLKTDLHFVWFSFFAKDKLLNQEPQIFTLFSSRASISLSARELVLVFNLCSICFSSTDC